MLFFTPTEQEKFDAIQQRLGRGGDDALAAAREYLTIAPDCGPALHVLGVAALQSGDRAEAIRLLWQAVATSPLHDASYASLAAAYDPEHSGIADHLRFVGLLLAATLDDRCEPPEAPSHPVPSDIAERFRPYDLLGEVANGYVSDSQDSAFFDRLKAEGPNSVTLCRAAVRSWARFDVPSSLEMIDFMIAMTGEYGGVEMLSDLWELAQLADSAIFRHANWAIHRIFKRFPEETVASIRARGRSSPVGLRCGMAEHLEIMHDTPGVKQALLDLVVDFPTVAGEPDAPYLLAAVSHALEIAGHIPAAREVIAKYQRLLSKEGRRWFEDHFEDFSPRLKDEDLAVHNIEDIYCGVLDEVDDLEEHFHEDDHFEDDDFDEPPEVKPGRNDPCWCGSGKKYKKCHLDADEQAEREEAELTGDDFAENEAMDSLLATAEKMSSKRELVRACRMFFGDEFDDADDPPEGTQEMPFLLWYLFDYRVGPKQKTILSEHLRQHESQLDPHTLSLLESWRNSRYGLFEVTAVHTGQSIQVTDVFTGESATLTDSSASPNDIEGHVLARLVKYGEEISLLPDAVSVPRRHAQELKMFIGKQAEFAGQSPADYVRENAHYLHRVVEEL